MMTENFRRWMPDHQPLWTLLGVEKLGLPGMNIEIEVIAYDPQQA
jgi:enamine deaminase RidA (YjgF/YER057c/UK114 family)